MHNKQLLCFWKSFLLVVSSLWATSGELWPKNCSFCHACRSCFGFSGNLLRLSNDSRCYLAINSSFCMHNVTSQKLSLKRWCFAFSCIKFLASPTINVWHCMDYWTCALQATTSFARNYWLFASINSFIVLFVNLDTWRPFSPVHSEVSTRTWYCIIPLS